jgi:hypothetical protein
MKTEHRIKRYNQTSELSFHFICSTGRLLKTVIKSSTQRKEKRHGNQNEGETL